MRKKTAEYLQYAEYLQNKLDNKTAVKAQVTCRERERERERCVGTRALIQI